MDKPFPKILYRGVDIAHPAYPQALQGIAPARGTERNVNRHNQEDTSSSVFVSFTTSLEVAASFATYLSGEGVILELEVELNETKLIESPDFYQEQEWLVEGPVEHLKIVTFVKMITLPNGEIGYEHRPVDKDS